MSVIVPISSASPLKADVAAVGRESPMMTRYGHTLGAVTSLDQAVEFVTLPGFEETPTLAKRRAHQD
jgi:hypothetical protein